MASINRLKRELLFKVVFYGPGLGGKTTTLRHVHAATKAENRGNMLSLATDTDRTLYFDYLPVKLLKVGSVHVKLQLYTVPGQVYYAATRKLVLSGADGIVFVADTQAARLDSNLESLDDLNANLAEQGRKLSTLPHLFQWNKRDLPHLVPLDELDRRLNLFGAPSLPTVAISGDGVFDVLERITRLVVEGYRSELPMTGAKADGIPIFLDADEVGLAGAIKELADSQPARPSPAGHLGLPRPTTSASPSRSRSSARGRPSRPVAAAAALASAEGAPDGAAQPLCAPVSPAGTFSFAELLAPADQESARRIEEQIATGDLASAIAASDALLSGAIGAASALLAPRPHTADTASTLSLLGVDGGRLLSFRAIVRHLGEKRAPTTAQALECYAFALEVCRTVDRALRFAH